MILDRPLQRRFAFIVPALALSCWSYACGDEETSGGDIPTGSTASSASSSGYFGSDGGAGQGGAASSASASGSGGDEGGAGGMMGTGGGSSMFSCADIEKMYMKFTGPMKQACSATTTCTLLKGHCMMGLGDACWYALDGTISQDSLDKAAGLWEQQGCQGTVCNACGPLPSGATCNEGTCEPVP